MKKIMTIIAAAAVALTLVGCANFGDAQASGTKYKKTFTLDASGDIKDSTGAAAAYARGFVALSASKSCSEIETTITLPKDDNIVEASDKRSVIGLAFDVHVTNDVANAGTYTRDLTEKETASKAKKAVEQVFMYGNAPSAADFFLFKKCFNHSFYISCV